MRYTISLIDDNVFARRELVRFNRRNSKGEAVTVELSRINASDSSVMKTWVKNGYIPAALSTWWSISTYVYDKDGNCWGRYNPQIKDHLKINFDWVLSGTEENKKKIIREIDRIAFNEEVAI